MVQEKRNSGPISKILKLLLLIIAGIALYLTGVYQDWYGRSRTAGEITGPMIAPEIITSRETAQADATTAIDQAGAPQILFGDLHVHTTFSTDAFLWSLPIYGGDGIYPLADACDYARYCSGIDFWAATDHAEASTPKRWEQSKQSIRDCNSRSGDPANPDMVSYIGFEWSQVGDRPDNHYGHKNVIFRDLEDERISSRAIASGGMATEVLRNQSSNMVPPFLSMLDFPNRQNYFDLRTFLAEIGEVPSCDAATPSSDLPPDCFELALTPGELVERLEDQNLKPLIIPHGSSWGFYTPYQTTWDKQLKADMRPEAFPVIEIMSGHGNSEEYRDYVNVLSSTEADGMLQCPAPTKSFTPLCWQAGEILRARCEQAGLDQATCDQRAAGARFAAANMSIAGHLAIGVSEPEEWLDAAQCTDCFRPAFNHRPKTSVQYGLAISNFDDPDAPRRFNWGFISASDNHRARPGTGYKPVDRLHTTEMSQTRSKKWIDRLRATNEVLLEAELITLDDRRDELSFNVTEVERQGSFWTTGGLAAVHAPNRSREAIFEAMENRSVYATSGPRILMWFDLVNQGAATGMGGTTNLASAPEFIVKAVGDFIQKPGCPDHVTDSLGQARVQQLCGGECYNPSDERQIITRIEIVRIRPQVSPDEDVGDLIEDPWMVHQCDGTPEGCRFSFTDPEFTTTGRDTTYYARAIQAPEQVINADPLRCEYDENGRCVKVNLCHGDFRQSREDNCAGPSEERAWSSPIYVSYKREQNN